MQKTQNNLSYTEKYLKLTPNDLLFEKRKNKYYNFNNYNNSNFAFKLSNFENNIILKCKNQITMTFGVFISSFYINKIFLFDNIKLKYIFKELLLNNNSKKFVFYNNLIVPSLYSSSSYLAFIYIIKSFFYYFSKKPNSNNYFNSFYLINDISTIENNNNIVLNQDKNYNYNNNTINVISDINTSNFAKLSFALNIFAVYAIYKLTVKEVYLYFLIQKNLTVKYFLKRRIIFDYRNLNFQFNENIKNFIIYKYALDFVFYILVILCNASVYKTSFAVNTILGIKISNHLLYPKDIIEKLPNLNLRNNLILKLNKLRLCFFVKNFTIQCLTSITIFDTKII